MRCLFAVVALVLAIAPAGAQAAHAAKGVKLGTACVGPVTSIVAKLSTCTIAGAKTRIWCPNGEVFDRDEDRTQVALIRSLCNLSQVP